ncbi:hypothetical protein ACLSY0_00395 [Avibacterium avium]|uniref:hypothetical protein n=1 Tax=Avibacterium avium TaxID=751 RepID=UPI003BF7B006
MKPFDLQEALTGKPVKLRSGQKAYVKYVLGDEYNTDYPLRGFAEYEKLIDGKINTGEHIWTLDGNFSTFEESETDIIGMWEEPKPKRYVNGIEVPEPVTLDNLKDGKRYWYVDFCDLKTVSQDDFFKAISIDKKLISHGFVFETQEGAEAMAKALLNYKVEVKNE